MQRQKLPFGKHKLLFVGLVVMLVLLIPLGSALAAGVFDFDTLFRSHSDSRTYEVTKVEVERTETPPVTTYTITYHPNGGSGTSFTASGLAGSRYVIINPSAQGMGIKSGFRLDHFNTRPDNQGTSYQIGSAVTLTGNMDLYAIWEIVQ